MSTLSKAKLVSPAFYKERMASHGFLSDDIRYLLERAPWPRSNVPRKGKFVFSHTIFLIRAFETELANTYFGTSAGRMRAVASA